MNTPQSPFCRRAALLGAAFLMLSNAQAGLIGEWRFNESGSTAVDSSGSGYDLTMRRDRTNAFDGHTPDRGGVSGWPGDRAFDPYSWNGYKNAHASSLGMIPESFTKLERFTVVLWVKMRRVPKFGETLFLMHADNRIKITFYTKDDSGWGTLEVNGKKIGTGVGWLSTSDIGRWVNLAVSYDSTLPSGAARFYRGDADTPIVNPFSQGGDGQASSFGPGSMLNVTRDTGLILGNVHEVNRTWCGQIDEVRVFDTVLGAAELDALRLKALAGP